MIFHIFLLFISFKLISATFYTEENSTDVFSLYKEKYNKAYKGPDEEKIRFKLFIRNLNTVEKLNEETTDNKAFFVINQYADLDPEEVEERYAVRVNPYNNVYNIEDAKIVARQKNKNVDVSELYNLDNATELYKEYLKKFGKKNHTKQYDYAVHFYRFVKTLIELNKNNFDGNGTLTLDEKADVIKEPNVYFY